MELSSSKIKKRLIRFQKKAFLIFSQKKPSLPASAPKRFFIFFSKKPALKNFLIFPQQSPSFSENGNPEKIFIFQKTKLSYTSGSNFLRSKMFYTFSYREAKFSKSKYFLIIIIQHFSSFDNAFSYTQQAFAFSLVRDFCNVHDHVVAFFFFFFRKILISFMSLFFVAFSYFLDNI